MSPDVVAALEIQDLTKHYDTPAGRLQALDAVSLSIAPGETLGVVGESGCGKTTLAKTVIGLQQPTGGRVLLGGDDITALTGRALKAARRRMQMVFQDPFGSLNPRLSVGRILREPFIVHGIGSRAEQEQRVRALADSVGLPRDALDRKPHEFSGGQRQRIGIARALALDPGVILCDEPVSALDVSVQAQVLNLLQDLQNSRGLAYLFISHDLGVVEYMADRVAVMYLGQVVELGESAALWHRPRHPYTMRLLAAAGVGAAAVASADAASNDEVPSPLSPPAGCRFHPRCPYVQPRCRSEMPLLRPVQGHQVACHFADSIEPAPDRAQSAFGAAAAG